MKSGANARQCDDGLAAHLGVFGFECPKQEGHSARALAGKRVDGLAANFGIRIRKRGL